MSRVFSTIVVAASVMAFLGTQTASAALVQTDSSSFAWKYEMNADPTTQNIDGVAGADWGFAAAKGTVADGILTTASTGYYSSWQDTAGQVWANVDFENGFTFETRLRTHQTGAHSAIGFMVGSALSNFAFLQVGDDSIFWGDAYAPTIGTPGGYDNSTDFHTYRFAQLPNQDSYSVWRDGKLVAEGLTSAYTPSDLSACALFGSPTSVAAGANEIDYVRITSGAFAPVPEPGTCVLLTTGLLGLVAYAWRKRR
jgi:hypothetical protein